MTVSWMHASCFHCLAGVSEQGGPYLRGGLLTICSSRLGAYSRGGQDLR